MPYLVPFAAIVFGLGLVLSAPLSRPWSRHRASLGLGIVLAFAALIWMQERAWAGLELNPIVSSPDILAGTWRLGDSVVILSPDGAWRCEGGDHEEPPCKGSVHHGRWTLNDYEITFSSPDGAEVARVRVITDRGRYRLLPNADGDPDGWRISHVYERRTV
jgi:hypothetical protein